MPANAFCFGGQLMNCAMAAALRFTLVSFLAFCPTEVQIRRTSAALCHAQKKTLLSGAQHATQCATSALAECEGCEAHQRSPCAHQRTGASSAACCQSCAVCHSVCERACSFFLVFLSLFAFVCARVCVCVRTAVSLCLPLSVR